MNNNYLGVPSFDSLKLSFDLNFVKILNTDLLDCIVNIKINKATGVVIEEQPIQQNSLKHEYDNYKIHFAINNSFGKDKLVVLVNSKLLDSEYMQGISIRNIERIHTKLMEAKIFSISFEDFLKYGTWSDVDIKRDDEIESAELFSKGIHELDKATVSQRRKDKGSNVFDKETNKGIEWNSRSKSTYTYPFLKIYHKGIESSNGKNKDFFETHVNLNEIKKVFRIEATIKNFSTDGLKYGLIDNSLISLLKLTTSQLNDILSHSIASNLEQRIKKVTRKKDTEITPTQIMLFKAITLGIQNNMSIESCIDYFIEDIPNAVSKSRSKKQLIEIYESEIKGQDYEVKTRGLNSFFDTLKWI
jgi:DNA-binding GntR family transcriptional regulator